MVRREWLIGEWLIAQKETGRPYGDARFIIY